MVGGDGVDRPGDLGVDRRDDLGTVGAVELQAVVGGRVVARRDDEAGGGAHLADGEDRDRRRHRPLGQPDRDAVARDHLGAVLRERARAWRASWPTTTPLSPAPSSPAARWRAIPAPTPARPAGSCAWAPRPWRPAAPRCRMRAGPRSARRAHAHRLRRAAARAPRACRGPGRARSSPAPGRAAPGRPRRSRGGDHRAQQLGEPAHRRLPRREHLLVVEGGRLRPAAMFVTSETAKTSAPRCRAAMASRTVDMPTRSAPIPFSILISAGVS